MREPSVEEFVPGTIRLRKALMARFLRVTNTSALLERGEGRLARISGGTASAKRTFSLSCNRTVTFEGQDNGCRNQLIFEAAALSDATPMANRRSLG